MSCEKIKNFLCQSLNSIILAGIILFFIGLYYWIVKTGIPYQDPTLEMQLEYTVNAKMGETLLKSGFGIAVCAGIIRLILGRLKNIAGGNR